MATLFMVLMFLTAVILILLVLVQRGKGGGLAGALGGMGGQSAFGTKAGDTFTKITIGVATFWILLCMVALGYMQDSEGPLDLQGTGVTAAPTSDSAGSGSAATGGSSDTSSTDAASPAAPASESE